MSFDEFRAALQARGIAMSMGRFRELLSAFDLDGDMGVQADEILALLFPEDYAGMLLRGADSDDSEGPEAYQLAADRQAEAGTIAWLRAQLRERGVDPARGRRKPRR